MARRHVRRRHHVIIIRRKRGKGLVGDILRAAAQPVKQRIKKKFQPLITQAKNVAKIVTTPYKALKLPIKYIKGLIP